METKQGISLEISHELIQTSFNDVLTKMLSGESYSNPVKTSLEKLLNSYGERSDKDLIALFDAKVKALVVEFIDTPEFKAAVGEATANLFAKEAMKSLNKR